MYALINNDTIEETRHTLPATWEHDGQLWDIRPGQHPPETAGWHPVIDTPRPDDTATHTHERTIRLIDGAPIVVWSPRAWEEGEIHARAEAEAMLTDLEARVSAIEAKLWPPASEDAPAEEAKTWDQLQPPNHWMPGTLLLDTDGKVWRNTSGEILTHPPSLFPGGGAAWIGRLFVEHTGHVEPEPEPEPGGAPPWAEGVAYSVGDEVTHNGHLWRAKLAHTSHSGWAPSGATHAVWEDLGPA